MTVGIERSVSLTYLRRIMLITFLCFLYLCLDDSGVVVVFYLLYVFGVVSSKYYLFLF